MCEMQNGGDGRQTGENAEPWSRLKRETARAYSAFLAFRDLGPARTLNGAYRGWKKTVGARAEVVRIDCPAKKTEAPQNWRRWKERHCWKQRAEAWDEWQRTEQEAREAAADAQLRADKRRQRRVRDELLRMQLKRLDDITDQTLAKVSIDPKLGPVLLKVRREFECRKGKKTIEFDSLRQLVSLSRVEPALAAQYFGYEDGEPAGASPLGLVDGFGWDAPKPDPGANGDTPASAADKPEGPST